MKILIAPDKYKDALDATRVAEAILTGLRRRADLDDCIIEVCPLADGGEGSGALVARATGAIERRTSVHDALGRRIEAKWWRDTTADCAYIEAAESVGLWRIPVDKRDALRASSFGVGELLRAAISHGAASIILFVGGTANVDGGAGCLQALGWTLCDASGNVIDAPACGADLSRIVSLRPPTADAAMAVHAKIKIEICTDVRNPLIGPTGAVPIFAPQKGARTAEQLACLSRGMENWAKVLDRFAAAPISAAAGAGAAGGIPAGVLAAFPGGQISAGAARIAALVGFDRHLAGTSLCITGEGRLDSQTGFGKVVAFVAKMCKGVGVPVVALVGAAQPPIGVSKAAWEEMLGIRKIVQITPDGISLGDALGATANNLESAARKLLILDR